MPAGNALDVQMTPGIAARIDESGDLPEHRWM